VKWPTVLQRKSFSHARRIKWVSDLAAFPFFARASKARLQARPNASNIVKPGILAIVAESAGAIFSILLSSVLILAVLTLLIAFGLELHRDAFSLESFSVPRDLLERGYSPAAVSEEVIAEIQRIQRAAATRHQRRNLESLMSLPDLQLSSSGLSMNSVVRYARRLLSLPGNRISGKIFQDGSETRLILVVQQGSRSESSEVHRSDGDIPALLKDAGRAIVQSVDGYVLASYLMDQEKRSGQFPATLAAVDYVLTHPPASDHPWALDLLGHVRHLQGQDDLALEAFRTVLALYPSFRGGPAVYVEQLVYMDRIEEARQFANARRQGAQSAAQWEQVFWMTHNLGDWLGAADAADHEVSLKGATGYGDLLHALSHAGHYAESLSIIENGLADDPKVFRPFVDGSLLTRAGRTQEGIDLAKAAVLAAADGGDSAELAEEFDHLGDVLVSAGQPAAAMVEFEHAMNRGIAETDLVFSYGDALIALDKPRQALQFFEVKMREQPRVWDGHVGAARAHVALGDYAIANQIFERVARESPLDPQMFLDWAKSLDAAGKTEEARNVRLRAVKVAEDFKRPLGPHLSHIDISAKEGD
jgi:tetratricopeptide (TPR) repeat protein